MPTCSQAAKGCDGHLECVQPGFSQGVWQERQCYACLDNLSGPDCTSAATQHCGTGCLNCKDHPNDMLSYHQKVWRTGKRFLRSRGIYGRDAYGVLSDLETGKPKPVPLAVSYERAPCWENDGFECFNTLCECSFAKGTQTPCTSNLDGKLRPGRHTDCTGYTQSGRPWPLEESNGGIDCRFLETEKGPVRVDLHAGELCEPVNHRTHSCAANMMVLALAKIAGSECGSGYHCLITCGSDCANVVSEQVPVCLERDQNYYADGLTRPEQRANWDTMILGNDVFMLHEQREIPEDAATVDAKNGVLAAVRTGSFSGSGGPENFQTLANRERSGGFGNIGLWSRDLHSRGVPVSAIPSAMPIRARLRQSGASVMGVLRVHEASIEVRVIVLPIGVPSTSGFGNPTVGRPMRWTPYVRARIRAWTYLDFPEFQHTLIRSWKVVDAPDRTVVIHAMPGALPDGLPVVTGPDELIFETADGVAFIPPRYVEWRGWLGEFSFPKTRHVKETDGISSNEPNELRIALSANGGVSVPGWSDLHEQRPLNPVGTYGGSLKIRWAA